MIGIYKITSPSNKIYIGQSTDIYKRFRYYKSLHCKKQIVLFRSLLKHGVDSHKFEIIEECNETDLNNKERYYQELYNCVGKDGLNCRLTKSTDKSGKMSCDTIIRMRGRKDSGNHLKKIILDTQIGVFYFGAKDAGKAYDIREDTLRLMLNGKISNTNNLIFLL